MVSDGILILERGFGTRIWNADFFGTQMTRMTRIFLLPAAAF
jgi:hypothetical protein